jgi:uncharacterized membrane protein (UPF0182 family)
MEETLEASLERIFGTAAPRPPDRASEGQQGTELPPAPTPSAASGLPAEARATYERALEAQRQGDWARYGEEIKRLGEILDRMAAAP